MIMVLFCYYNYHNARVRWCFPAVAGPLARDTPYIAIRASILNANMQLSAECVNIHVQCMFENIVSYTARMIWSGDARCLRTATIPVISSQDLSCLVANGSQQRDDHRLLDDVHLDCM